MKRLTHFIFAGIFIFLSFNVFADACTHGIRGSGADLGPKYIKGKGTKSKPFRLTNGMNLCDITLVKNAQIDDPDKNLSYPNNTIYFRYKYKNIPLNYKGLKVNTLFIVLGTNQLSSFTSSNIVDTKIPSDPNNPCRFVLSGDSTASSKRYSASCNYAAGPNTPSDIRISGVINFSISLVGDQEIKRVTDKTDPKNPKVYGAGTLSVKWLIPPQKSNFNM